MTQEQSKIYKYQGKEFFITALKGYLPSSAEAMKEIKRICESGCTFTEKALEKYFLIKKYFFRILYKLKFLLRKATFIFSLKQHYLYKQITFLKKSRAITQKEIACRYKIDKTTYAYLIEKTKVLNKGDKYLKSYICNTLGLHGEDSSKINKVIFLKKKIFVLIENNIINSHIFYARICKEKGEYKVDNTTHYIY